MAPTREQREERYQNASERIQEAYGSSETGAMLMRLEDKYQLSNEVYKSFALTVGDVILGFFQESELPQLLQERVGMSNEQAREIARDLHDFLANLPESEKQTIAKPEEGTKPGMVSSDTNQTPTTPEQEPAVPPVRTMEGDAERIHGYGAYRPRRNTQTEQAQPAKSQLADLPRYEDGEQSS